ALKQRALGGVRLVRRRRASDGADVLDLARARAAQDIQVTDALGARDDPRVGDRVGGASEQVGEPERLAQRARQDGEREIEAPADPAQQVAEELVTPLHLAPDYSPGRESPAPDQNPA